MKILITGANGQLGNEMRIALAAHPQLQAIYTDVAELDICNRQELQTFVATHSPTHIVNCAAYTAVDKAESDEANAHKINALAVENIAHVAAAAGVKVIHISTDYVFDGTGHTPYSESDNACPHTVYGKTKLLGEQLLLQHAPESIVIRTAWLYSSFGNNFVKTMLRLGSERPTLNVVADQIGSPTYAADLAQAIVQILQHDTWVPGIYHFTNEGVCSWYDFAHTILQLAGKTCSVQPITTSEYPTPTPRPAYSVLSKQRIKSTYKITIPHWSDSLKRCLNLMGSV